MKISYHLSYKNSNNTTTVQDISRYSGFPQCIRLPHQVNLNIFLCLPVQITQTQRVGASMSECK